MSDTLASGAAGVGASGDPPSSPAAAAGAGPSSYSCPYCQLESTGSGLSCPNCGAPVDVALRTTASGWTELPPVRDMAQLQFGHSSAQIAGSLVPVAEMNLAGGEGVYFAAHHLLWQDPEVAVEAMSLREGWKRRRAGMPVVMMQATGPGRIAFSHDSAGEMIALPLGPDCGVDVREHCLVAATLGVAYDWYDSDIWFNTRGNPEAGAQQGGVGLLKMGLDMAGVGGLGGRGDRRERQAEETRWVYPVGQHVDRFVVPADSTPGVVLVQAGGAAFTRQLAAEESILVKPPALLCKGLEVQMQLHVEFPSAGAKLWRAWANRYLWLRLSGPGRVTLQSGYDRLEDPGTDFRESCRYTQRAW